MPIEAKGGMVVSMACFSGCCGVVLADYPRGGSSRSIPLADSQYLEFDFGSALDRLYLRCIAESARMSSTAWQIASIVAGLALFATQIFVVPRDGIRGLVKGLAVTVSLAIFAACLITAIRSFGS
jgi:hypothetical protein